MKLVLGVFFLAAMTLGFAITLIGARDPRKPAWANDFLVGNVYSIAIIGALVAGLGLLIQFLWNVKQAPATVLDVGLAAGVAAVAAIAIKALRIRKRLAAFAAMAEAKAARPPEGPGDGRPVEPAGAERRRLAA